jgi:O-antigen/teichoic acid export membrane protein
MSRTRRSVASFASALLLQVITLLIGIVSTPLLLKWLGDDRFGAFRSVSDWLGHLKILELGLSGALMPVLASALGQNDRSKVQLTLAVGIRAYCKVVLLMLGAAIVLGCSISHLIPIQKSLTSELQTAYWIGLSGFLMIPLSPFRLLTEASQRSDIVNFSLILQSLIITSASLYLASLGMGLPGQFVAVAVGIAIAAILVSWQSLRQYPGVLLMAFRLSSQTTRPIRSQLQKLSVPTLFLNFSGHLGLLTDNLLIAYFLGSASVVPFVMTLRLFAIAQLQLQSIGNSTWSALADLYFRDELHQFNLRLIQLTRLVATGGVVLIVPILVYNFQFVKLWVGAERFAGWEVSTLGAINVVILGVLSLWGWCFSGTGNVTKIARIGLIAACVNILVGLLATPSLKLIAPLLGTLISSLTVQLWGMLYYLKQLFGVSRSALLQAIVRPFLIAMFYMPGAIWFAQSYPPKGWIELGLSMSFTGLVFLIVVWFTLLKPEERHQWSEKVKRLSPLARFS